VSPPPEESPEEQARAEERLHSHRLTLFSVSSGMVGVCLTAVGLIGVLKSLRRTESIIDELLTFDALVFLTATALYFALLRRRRRVNHRWLDHIADATFFLALALLLLACLVFTMEFRVEAMPAAS
jgi:hypothetical protein